MVADDPVPKWEGEFRILALDGGGIKGLFSAAVLASLEQDLGVSIEDHFDLITGTSTGGIIALALGCNIRPHEIVHFYMENAARIFPQKRWFQTVRWLRRCKYEQEPLKTALQACLGENRMADSKKRLVIPSYNLDKDEVYLFKTPHHAKLRRDWQVPMWKVALATSAAPTYFPSCHEIDHIRLIDGGIWANNPTLIGIVEAFSLLNVPLDAITVLSLGTTNAVANKPDSLNDGGLWHWRKAGIDAALRGQSHGIQGQAEHLLGAERMIRIDPPVPDGVFAMDKLTESRLLSEAESVSRYLSPTFNTMFLPHKARPFEPLYPTNSTED